MGKQRKIAQQVGAEAGGEVAGQPTIRMATAADALFVYRLMCDRENEDFAYDAFCERFETQLADARHRCLIAECAGEPMGLLNLKIGVHLHHVRPTAEICELVVGEALVARASARLAEHALAIARREGCELCEVTSNRARTGAHHFCERHDFAKTHWHLTMPLEWHSGGKRRVKGADLSLALLGQYLSVAVYCS